MGIEVFAKRIGLAYAALRGHLDDVPGIANELTEARNRLARFSKAMCDLAEQRDYWYGLWFSMGRDFENTQNVLCEKIDELRRRIPDEWDGKPFFDGKVQEHWHKTWVDPKHPVNPNACPPDFTVENPPQPPEPDKV